MKIASILRITLKGSVAVPTCNPVTQEVADQMFRVIVSSLLSLR